MNLITAVNRIQDTMEKETMSLSNPRSLISFSLSPFFLFLIENLNVHTYNHGFVPRTIIYIK